MLFFLKKKKKKNDARKRQWQIAMNRWDLATKKWEPKHHDVLCSKHFNKTKQKMLHRSHHAEHSVWAQIHVQRVTNLDKFPVRIFKDETPMPLPVVGPLFISPLSFVSQVIAFIYDVRVRGVVSMFNETAQSFFVWGSLMSVSCPTVLLALPSRLYRVHRLRVSSLCHVAR